MKLRNGMIVTLKNGKTYVVVSTRHHNILYGNFNRRIPLDKYNDELQHERYQGFNIEQVYDADQLVEDELYKGNLIWERVQGDGGE